MAIEQSIQLVEVFLDRYSADASQFKKDRAVLLSIDGDLNVAVVADEGFIRLTAMVGNVPKNEILYYDLLAENLKSAGHSYYQYAIEPQSNELLMSLVVQSDDCTANKFIKLSDDFIAKCKEWMNLLYSIGLDISGEVEQIGRYRQKKYRAEDFSLSDRFLKA